MEEVLKLIDNNIKEIIESCYVKHDSDSYFKLDEWLKFCKSHNFTEEEIPSLRDVTIGQ